ncbi:MAG: histidine kinase dimerization/phospho-acceptor domain-containing protein, partial [Elusimicrobiota bacterium]
MRLQTKVLVLSLPLSAAFAALAAGLSSHAAKVVMVGELGRRLTPQVEDYAARLAQPLVLGRENRLISLLQSSQKLSGAFFSEILDAQGLVVAHTSILEKGKRREDETAKRALAARQTHFALELARGERALIISTPIRGAEEEFILSARPRARLGTLRLALPLKHTLDSARRLGLIMGAMAAGFCLLGLAIILMLVRMIVGPVAAISAATARVASGDYTVKVPAPTSDEVGLLAESFNRMSETLSRTVVSRDQLEHALSLAQAAMDASADGILVIGPGLKAISMNNRFIQMWNFPQELAASKDMRRLAPFALPQLQDPDAFMAVTTKHSWDFEAADARDILRLKDGRVFERITTPFRVGGHAAGRTVTTRDLTLHYEVLAALSRARDEALEAARIKTQFLTGISHELRTPLNAVVAAAGLLSGTKLDDEQSEYAETLSRAAHALLEIVEGILDFSKIEAGRMTVESTVLRVGPILKDAFSMVATQAASQGLSLRIDAGEAASWDLMGDPTRLRQVLTNLLANAVKFTKTGTVSADVRVLPSQGSAVA